MKRIRSRPTGAALALTLAASLPAAAATTATADMTPAPIAPPKLSFEKITLANGLQVILHEDHAVPMVAVNLWYHVGSKNEKRGRTGFAHLFEHMMYQGSEHHDKDFFLAVEPLGATDLNGTTDFDRTCYFQNVPKGALENILWLEADRMGWLLPAMTQERLSNQIEVVKNERRQAVDNQPYGRVEELMYAAMFPPHHPYSWDVIGYMEDLTASEKADVEQFFKDYYGPNNCTLVVAGDIDPARTKLLVEKYFGSIPPGPPVYRAEEWVPELEREVRLNLEDRVPLPKLYVAWHAPGYFRPGQADLQVLASVLATGKTSRLYKRLVYDLQLAQDVTVQHDGRELGGLFWVQVTARPGRTLDEIEPLVLEEVERIRQTAPTAAEVEQARSGILSAFVRGLERIGGFGGKSDRLAMYNTYMGDPGYLGKDFASFQAVTPASVQAAAKRWLHGGRAVMRVQPFPELQAGLAATGFDRTVAPAVAAAEATRLPAFQRAKLSNGLDVVLVESHKVPVVELSLLVRGGWSADRAEKPGVASFTARMHDEGTAARTALDISAQAETLGARLTTGSNLDSSTVRLSALKARLAPALDLWADVLLNPAFPQSEIDRQRDEVLAKILQEKKRPISMGLRVLPGLLYGESHPYGQPLTGSGHETSVKAISRDDLVRFHQTWFRPNNATLIVVGDTTLAEIQPLLESRLAGWKAGDVPALALPQRPQPEKTAVYIIDKPGAAQSVLLAGHLLPPRNDPDSVSFEALNQVLGGQFIARMNMNLRESKGYTYGAYTFPIEARGQGMLLSYAEVRSDVTRESLVEMMKELREIRDTRPVSAEELRQAHDSLTLSLPGQFETMTGITDKVNEQVLYGLPEDFHSRYQERVRATTVASLTSLARSRVLPDNMVVVVIGDRQAIEPKLRELSLGPIAYLDADGHRIEKTAQQ